jgi:hypothetical protein
VIRSVTDEGISNGIEVGDELFSIDGNEANMALIYKIYRSYPDKKVGTPIQLVLKRNGEKLEIQTSMIEKIDSHVFIVNPDATKEQIELREKWMAAL